MQEFPAIVKHEGLPRRPTEVRRIDPPLTWRVIEVVHAKSDVVFAARPARRVYRLQGFGPLPYAPELSGTSELLSVGYPDRAYWWNLRKFTHTEGSSLGNHGLLERHGYKCGGLQELLQHGGAALLQ